MLKIEASTYMTAVAHHRTNVLSPLQQLQRGGASNSPVALKVLEEAARHIEADVSWYETLGLHLNGECHGVRGTVSVTAVLDSKFDQASEVVIVPVLNVFKELFDAVGAAPNSCDESLELTRYSVVTLRCLLKSAWGGGMSPKMAMTFGELKGEMENVQAFVLEYGSRTGFCRKAPLTVRDSKATAKLKRKLDGLLDAALRGFSGAVDSVDTDMKVESREPRHKLTFVSHAGEEKEFVRSLLKAIEQTNVAAFFDDDMTLGTTSVDEMESRAAEADQAIVVLSRSFLTKEWPMKELNIFLENEVSIHPLFYGVTPDELWDIVATYDRFAGDDGDAAKLKMNDPREWKRLMEEIGGPTRFKTSTSLPDPLLWRRNVEEIGTRTGLRFGAFEGDEASYVEAIARIVSPPRLPDCLPSLPNHYVKPPLVDDVIRALRHTTPRSVSRGVVLTGIGGAGKSVIATACARDKTLRRDFRDGILWFNGKSGEFSEKRFLVQLNSLAKQFREVVLARHYRQGPRHERTSQYFDTEFRDLRIAQDFFLMWQKKFDLRCLLVVDGAWNVQVLEAAGLMGFRILATTRNKDVMPASPGWCALMVPEMEADASLLVLSKCSGASGSVPTQPALQVAKDCSFLPQALAIVGSMPLVVDAPQSADAWRKLHENLKAKAELLEHHDDQQRSLNSALGVSFDELGREQRGRFLKLAVLANGTAASKSMLSHLWEQDLADCRVAVKDLATRSLVQDQNDMYVVHDLMLDLVKRKIEEEDALKKVAILRQSEYLGELDVLRSYLDKGVLSGDVYPLMALWRSVESLSGDGMLEVNIYKTRLAEREITSDAEMDVVEELNAVARLFDLQGKLDDAEPLYSQIQGIVGTKLGKEHPMYAAALSNWAGLYDSQGKYHEADELYAQAIEIGEKVLSNDDPALAEWLTNRAMLLQTQGKFDQAMALYDRSLTIREKVLGTDHPHVAVTLNGKGYLLMEQGRYTEAEQLLKQSIEIVEKALGPSNPNLAYQINNLAILMVTQGNYDEAYDLYVRATDIFEEALGPLHENVASLLNNRACLLQEMGRYEEADSLLARVVEIGEENLGSDHSVVARRLNNRVASMIHLGKYSAAESMQTRIPQILEKALGREHPLVATSLNNQAVLLEKEGRYDAADSLFLRAIKIVEDVLGPDHPHVAVSLSNRALLLEKQGRYEEADQLYVRALEIEENTVGPDHRNVGTVFHNRAALMELQGKTAHAEALYERANGILERALGPEHLQVASALSRWAELLRKQRQYDKADPLFVRAIEIAKKSGSVDYETLAATLNNRAWLLKAQERFVEAESMFMQAMEIWKEALGPTHPHVATALNNLGELLRAQGKSDEAEPFYRRALTIDEEAHGSNHQAVAINLNNLAMALENQGKCDEADGLYRRVVAIDEEAYGPDHPVVAADLTNLAMMLTSENKHAKAIPLLERALAIKVEELGELHEDTVTMALMLEDAREAQEEQITPQYEAIVRSRSS